MESVVHIFKVHMSRQSNLFKEKRMPKACNSKYCTKRPNMKFAPAVRATVQYMGSTVRFAEDATIFQTLGACMPLDGI